jgi:hypothetical protein
MSVHMLEAAGSAAAALKLAANISVFLFLIWSMYFATSTDFGIVRDILAFVALVLFSGFVGMLLFGMTFAPLLFEW